MARLLVTGASGFIGRRVCEALLRRGDEVHGVTHAGAIGLDARVRWHRADLLAPEAPLRTLLESVRPEGLVHLAWYVAHGKYWTAPENRLWREASANLLSLFSQTGGKRALCAGTCAEYDYRVEGPYREDQTPVMPQTLYGACKDGLRQDGEALARRGLSFCWVRLFHLYGPGETATRLWPRLHAAFSAGKPFPLAWHERRRAFLHVDDAGEAFAALWHSGFEGPVNLGSAEVVSLGDLARRIARKMGREELVQFMESGDPSTEPVELTAHLGRLHGASDWRAKFSLEEGVAELTGQAR